MLHIDFRGGRPLFMHNATTRHIAQAPKWMQEVAAIVERNS
jgi:hypothetical protein